MTPDESHRNFSWRCHVCGDERPNSKISVAKHIHRFPKGFEVANHVRYCNDRDICTEVAMLKNFEGIALEKAGEEIVELSKLSAKGAAHFLVGFGGGILLGFLVPIAFFNWTPW